jgi:hypothetical protein
VDPRAREIQSLILQCEGDAEGLLAVVAEHGPAVNVVNAATCLNRQGMT